MASKIYYNRIKDYCDHFYISYARIGRMLGVTRVLVSMWGNNKSQPSNEYADIIYDFFKGLDKDLKKEDLFPIKPFNPKNLK